MKHFVGLYEPSQMIKGSWLTTYYVGTDVENISLPFPYSFPDFVKYLELDGFKRIDIEPTLSEICTIDTRIKITTIFFHENESTGVRIFESRRG